MVLRGTKRKGVRYFGPYAHAYAIRETLDLLLRTFPIRTCTKTSSTATTARPAVPATRTSRSARRRASATSTTTSTTARPRADRLPRRRHRRGRRPPRAARCASAADELEFERAARLRDQLAWCARRSSASRWSRAREEDFDLIGIVEDELEAACRCSTCARAGSSAARASSSTRSRTSRRPRSSRASSSSSTPTRPRTTSRGRSSSPSSPRTVELYEEFLDARTGGAKVRVRVPAARRQARAARRPRRSTPREAFARHKLAPGVRPQRPGARAASRSRRRSTSPRRRCASSASTSRNLQGTEIVASMVVMEDGLAEALRLPALQGPDARRPGRLRVDGGGAHPPLPQLPARARRGRGRRQAVRVPAEPAAHRRRQGPARRRGARARGARPRGHLRRQPRQAVRGGVRARQLGADPHPARLRGAVPAAAGARRGPPLRDHVPPPAARQEDDAARCSTTSPASARRARSGSSRSSAR